MGLDATIYCDCFELGRLRTAPLVEWHMFVDAAGSRSAQTSSHEQDVAFDNWNLSACEHSSGVLLHHRIGNIARVAEIRQALTLQPAVFRVILSKIVYSGTHTGDIIGIDQLAFLKEELRALSGVHSDNPVTEESIRQFEEQLHELLATALRVNKPISF